MKQMITIAFTSILTGVTVTISAMAGDKLEDAHQKLEDDYLKAEQQLGLCAKTRSDLQKQLGITGAEKSKLELSVEELESWHLGISDRWVRDA